MGTYSRAILHRLLIDLSWVSSHLEGKTYSRLETRELIEHGRRSENWFDTSRLPTPNPKRLTAGGWAISLGRAQQHGAESAILRVPPPSPKGGELGQFDPYPISHSVFSKLI